jgi:very-short-patch-repair endonuclease
MSGRTIPPLPSRSRRFAQELRQAQTNAELRLWERLRSSRLAGLKFRRQHPVPPYVLDFYCESEKLAVELDGSQHTDVADAQRTQFLAKRGIKILRFWDNDVFSNFEAVLSSILASVQAPTLTPDPSPTGRGENSEQSQR